MNNANSRIARSLTWSTPSKQRSTTVWQNKAAIPYTENSHALSIDVKCSFCFKYSSDASRMPDSGREEKNTTNASQDNSFERPTCKSGRNGLLRVLHEM